MRFVFAVILLGLLGGCSDEQVEEIVFRKTLEYELRDDCGDDDACRRAVSEQIAACMEEHDWRRFMENQDDPEETQRFVYAFFPCFKNPQGESYFDLASPENTRHSG